MGNTPIKGGARGVTTTPVREEPQRAATTGARATSVVPNKAAAAGDVSGAGRSHWGRGLDLGAWVDKAKTFHWDKGNATAMALRALSVLDSRADRKVIRVPLRDLNPVHGLSREDALDKSAARKAALQQIRPEVEAAGALTFDLQYKHLPSKTPIRVVQDMQGASFVIDGNGRLDAIRSVFDETLPVDVELVEADNKVVSELVHHLREVRGLE